jgi:hypothetical protein
MQQYSDFFKTLHDETGPTGYLGRGTHYSVLRAVVFHDPAGNSLPAGQFADFAVIWDEDHDVRVMKPIEEIYRRGLLSGFVMFGERKGNFTAILSNKVSSAVKAAPFNLALLMNVKELSLSERAANCLDNENIIYVGDLVQRSEAEMLRVPNFGRTSLHGIKDVLVQMGLHLGMELPGWPPEDVENLRKYKTRVSFLEAAINSICQALDDRWTSAVVPFESKRNPIISDEEEKVSLYLKNLEMIWRLGVQTKQRQNISASLSDTDTRTERPAPGADAMRAGYIIDLSGSR